MNDGSSSSSSSSSSTKMDVGALVDESYFSGLFDYDEVFPISDENYATELYLQEALLSSLIASTVENTNHHPHVQTNYATLIKQEETEIKVENESKEPYRRLCMICMDEKPASDMFRGTTNCTHSYCTDCTIRYVATKIKENVARIKCPDMECTRFIEPYTCRDLIPEEVFERWEKNLCESLILSWDKFYCPFKDCLAMMVDDGSNAKVTQTECPSCHRLFCVQCQVKWHAGIGCEEFQRYGKTRKKSSDEEDALLIQMAKSKQWSRCPSCKFYVEKVDGCSHIRCRCGFQFCYRCGAAWDSHRVCPTSILRNHGIVDGAAIPTLSLETELEWSRIARNYSKIAIPKNRRPESIWKRILKYIID